VDAGVRAGVDAGVDAEVCAPTRERPVKSSKIFGWVASDK
jgi:hypothetical protein